MTRAMPGRSSSRSVMTIRIVKRGAAREKPFCPLLIDYPYEQPEPKQETESRK